MKKSKIFLTIILAVLISVSFISCKGKVENEASPTTSAKETTTVNNLEKTTVPPADTKGREDKDSSKELKNTVISVSKNKDDDKYKAEYESGNDAGYFTYKYTRDAKLVYSNERSEDMEKLATENANSVTKELQKYYGELKLLYEDFVDYGANSENGIDSVSYNFYYTSANGGELRIIIDSDGVISYISSTCSFDKA